MRQRAARCHDDRFEVQIAVALTVSDQIHNLPSVHEHAAERARPSSNLRQAETQGQDIWMMRNVASGLGVLVRSCEQVMCLRAMHARQWRDRADYGVIVLFGIA